MRGGLGAYKWMLTTALFGVPCILSASLGEALIDAARSDDRAAVARLLGRTANVNEREADGSTALAWAAIRRNADVAGLLLGAGANPDLANAFGIGPLSLAIENGAANLVRLLLEHGANPNVARESGETPLMTAVRLGQVEVVEQLLEHGADVNAREKKFGQNALMWAAGTPATVRLLLNSGAEVHTTTKTWDVEYTIYVPTTFTLGKTGIPWNSDGTYVAKKGGQNALFFAIRKRDLDSARILVDAGLDVNDTAPDGTTALLASLYNWVPLAADFVQGQGAPALAGSSQRFGPDLAIARFLLERGASATEADTAGYTPLHAAALSVVWSRRSGETNRQGVYRGAPALLSLNHAINGPPPFSTDEALAVVERLLEIGADPNRQTVYPTPGPTGDVRLNPVPPGSSALHIAAHSNSVALVKMLADGGADPNLVRKDGHTPFSVAVVAGDLSVIKELVASGAHLSARYDPADKIPDPVEAITLSRQGQTIVHIAAASRLSNIVEYLHSQGAPIDWRNEQGETPLDLADHQERFQEALQRQNADGDPERLSAVKRPTETTDLIKKILAGNGGQTAGDPADNPK